MLKKKKISHGQDFYSSGVAQKVPFPSLQVPPKHTGGSLGSGLVPAGSSCRSQKTPLHPCPHPLLHPRAAEGHTPPHPDLPQPNPAPCRHANPPRGAQGPRTKRGPHCTPSWPRTPGLSLDVGVAHHMWPWPGWQGGPGFPSPKPRPQRAAPRFGSCPAPRGAHDSWYLLGQGWAGTQGETQLHSGDEGLRGRQT